ncbi:hypothetical protein JAO71_15540 [Olleya sp. YSTF-M6]|uniref:Uncharacterized protein n=1 Tax=Olleya sediminilitoris TaxID=2795739 RepID=A0ABS1WQ06_9FLAO|nr:hypothetical protein [Olleya sediminilitoris]MBL7561211.1 hypothetical protein [Olleya sediminilitoris]
MEKEEIEIDVRIEENLETNLGKLQILNAEIDIVLKEIKNRLEEKKNIERKDNSSSIRRLNLIEDPLQLRINLHCKTFLFVFRQFISKYFRALYQSKEILGYENVGNKLPDLSVDGGVKKKLVNLLKGTYDYDKDILKTIQEGSDFLIVSRFLRNSIKKYAVLITHIIYEENGINFNLNFPLDNETKDETLLYVKEKLIKMEDTSNFTVKVGFFDNCQLYANNLFDILIKKLDEKKYFENKK